MQHRHARRTAGGNRRAQHEQGHAGAVEKVEQDRRPPDEVVGHQAGQLRPVEKLGHAAEPDGIQHGKGGPHAKGGDGKLFRHHVLRIVVRHDVGQTATRKGPVFPPGLSVCS